MRKQEVFSLTGFELLIMIVVLSITIAILIAPGPIYNKVHSSAWYVPLLALIPGLLYTLIYQSLIKNSPYPLPRMLEYYWGSIIGWILSLFYAWFFLTWVTFWVRLFLDFQLSAIIPLQPISVLLAGILMVALYGLKRGLTTTVRALEIIFGIVVLFQFFIIALGMIHSDFANLLPIYHTKPLTLASSVLLYSRFYAVAGICLIFSYFITDGSHPTANARRALVFAGLTLAAITIVTIGVLGNLVSNHIYPVFDMVRQLNIGTFIRNLDALFIAIWFVGIFFGIYLLWFSFIYTLQQMFRLQDYRPLAPATILIVGVLAIGLGASTTEVSSLQLKVMYPLLLIFMVGIPFLTWIVGLIRGKIRFDSTASKSSS